MLDLAVLVAVVAGGTALGLLVVTTFAVGTERLRRRLTEDRWLRRRLRAVAPAMGALAAVLVVNKGLQGPIERFSHAYGVEATAYLYAIEGDLVVAFQSLVPSALMALFAAVYVVGYAVLLVAPLAIYLFAADERPMASTLVAYLVNYAAAVVFYATVVAYGPRNAERGGGGTSADAALLELVPNINHLTALVNTNTNVFPSLHVALSVTVALLAWRTRAEFPRWTAVAVVLAAAVVVSTMALGIHWLTDAVVGAALAVVAVGVAERVTRPEGGDPA